MTRILLEDLTPGTNYAVQLRSNSGDRVSKWSRKFSITTTADTTPPTAPNWIFPDAEAWKPDGTSFLATWQEINFSLEANRDFSHYELVISDGVKSVTIKTTNTAYVLSFEENLSYFGTPRASLTAKVRAVDSVGNASNYSDELTAVNPAPASVANVIATEMYDSISISWDESTEPDFKDYVVTFSVNGVGGPYNLAYVGRSNSYIHQSTLWNSDHHFRVFAKDIFDSLSVAVTTDAVRPKSTFSVDTNPPDAPTGVSAVPGFNNATQEAYIDLSWNPNTEPDLSNYTIRYGQVEGQWSYVNVDGNIEATRITVEQGGIYYIGIAAKDYTANISTFTNATPYPVTASVDATPPSKPSVPVVASNAMQAQISHDGTKATGGAIEPDTVYWNVYASLVEGFTPLEENLLGRIQNGPSIVETFFLPSEAATGTSANWYFRVSAVDAAGNESDYSDEVTASVPLLSELNIGDATITSAKIASLDANKITAGTGIISDLNVKSILTIGAEGLNGVVRSGDYVSTSAKRGFYLDSDELIIKSGSISASAIQLSDNVNLMPFRYSSFEYPSYSTFIITSNATFTLDTVDKKSGTQSLRVVTSSTNNSFYLDSNVIPTGALTLQPGGDYTISIWAMQKTGTTPGTWTPFLRTKIGVSSAETIMPQFQVPADGVWRRFTFNVTVNPLSSGEVALWFRNNVSGVITYFDDIQIEAATSALSLNGNFETTIAPWSGVTNSPTLAQSGVVNLSGLSSLSITATATAYWDARSSTSITADGMAVVPGQFYQAMMWARAATTARTLSVSIEWYNSAGTFISASTGPTGASSATTWTAYTTPVSVAPPSAAYAAVRINCANAPTSDVTYIDLVKLWPVAAEAWRPPGGTSIDGSLIKTGSIQSNELIYGQVWDSATNTYVTNTAQPAWAINTFGDATFNKMLVRGTIIVGESSESPETTTNLNGDVIQVPSGQRATIASGNYIPGLQGWILRSDGYAEFRNLYSNSISGDVITAGTLSVNTITPNDTLLNTIFVEGAISAVNADPDDDGFGSSVTLSGDGFIVKGPDSAMNPTYVSFPTNGAPNIVSGALKANTMTVDNGATFSGNNSLKHSSKFVLNNLVKPSLAAPVPNAAFEYGELVMPEVPAGYGNYWTTFKYAFYKDGFIYGIANVSDSNAPDTGSFLVKINANGTATGSAAVLFSGGIGSDGSNFNKYAVGLSISPSGIATILYVDTTIAASWALKAQAFNPADLTLGSIFILSDFTKAHAMSDGTIVNGSDYFHTNNYPNMALASTDSHWYVAYTDIGNRNIKVRRYPINATGASNATYTSNFAVNGTTGATEDQRNILVSMYYTDTSLHDFGDSTPRFIMHTAYRGPYSTGFRGPYEKIRPFTLSGTTLTQETSKIWHGAGVTNNSAGGLYWDGTNFGALSSRATFVENSVNNSITSVRYSNIITNGAKQTWHFASTYYRPTGRTLTVGTTSGSTTVTGNFFTSDIGAEISGTGIPAGARISSVSVGVSAVISSNATATGSPTATISYETVISPAQSMSMLSRANWSVTVDESDDGSQVYIATTASPVRTDYHRQDYYIAPGSATLGYSDAYTSTSSNPPATQSFEATTDAEIYSENVDIGTITGIGTTSGSTNITSGGGFRPDMVGMELIHANLPAGTRMVTYTSGTAAVVDTTATATGTAAGQVVRPQIVLRGGGFARIKELYTVNLLSFSTTDASTSAGNKPALRVGNPSGNHLRIDGNEIIQMSDDSTQGDLLLNITGNTQLNDVDILGVNVDMPNLTTGTFTANLNWNSSNGRLRVNTSSKRFKENIAPVEIDTAKVLSLEPKKFTRNDEEGDETPEYYGFIAEEAHDLGLYKWVVYDEQGPWSFAYDQWVVALQAVVREQDARIKALEERLSGK